MTTSEFQLKLDKANTLAEIQSLRISETASLFVSLMKAKITKIAPLEGFSKIECSLTTMKNLTPNSDTNNSGVLDIPKSNRTFSAFAGGKMFYYVNHKEGSKFQTVQLFVKKV